jgi:flagellar biosynthesis protein FlhB
VLSTKPLEPELNRISPLAGFGRLFSMQQLVDVTKLLLTASVMLFITYGFIAAHWQELGHLLMQPSAASLEHAANWVVRGVAWLMLVVLVIAAIDVPVQRFFHKRQLRMSHDEIRREHKEADGNPEVKARIRQRQRQMAHRSSLKAVPKADLVLMNPTHYAVALKYDERSMAAPQVIAKGADLLAQRIRDLAQTHQVPVIQAPALARALYAHAELNREVPQALYTAVAQVLAYVYRLRAAWRGQGPLPAQAPNPEVPAELDPHQAHPAHAQESAA